MSYLEIGSVPAEESCQQVGTPSYDPYKARKECRVFKHMLQRMFGEPPGSARFCVKGFDHDFGIYHEVCVSYNDNDEAAIAFAFKVEAECPGKWDDKALIELMPSFNDPVDCTLAGRL